MSKIIIYKLLTILSTENCTRFLGLILFLGIGFSAMSQQKTDSIVVHDSVLQQNTDSLSFQDTLTNHAIVNTDTTVKDSDSYMDIARNSSVLDTKVAYPAQDSIRFDLGERKVYMYNKAQVIYGSLDLQGDYMEIDFNKKEIFARGIEDTTGAIIGSPIFKESEDEFESEEIHYNFQSKKGLIKGVRTEESGGYLHGEIIKKMPDNTAWIQGGQFTTCDLKDPHYSFRFRRSKVIPGDKIVTGPAFFEVANVPTPLMLPFGLFPNQQGKQSGIIPPEFGEVKKMGYYLKDGGYYWAINDYVDLTVKGTAYSRGSWALNTLSDYKVRYRYSGSVDLKYAVNITGSEGSPDYQKGTDFRILWSHKQDPKARPKSNFSANVNIRSSSFNEFEMSNTMNDRLSNTFSSSVNYKTSFGNGWNLNLNLGHSQNTKNKTIELKLPEISLSGTRFYPLRKRERKGSLKWYENISVKYSVVAKNQVKVADSVIFTPGWEQYFQNGMKHTVPISSTVKILKHLNWTNSVNLTSRWYSQHYDQHWIDEHRVGLDTIPAYVKTDTVHGFVTANDFDLSSSFATRLYGMYMFGKKSPVQALRHVLSPTVSFSYRPDFSESQWGYYEEYYNSELEEDVQYSVFQGSVYGSPGSGKQGALNFSLANNFEMKVRDKSDTVTGSRKVVLIDNLAFSTSYNMAKDSLRWAPLLISARTKLFKNLDIKYASAWDPYVLDSAGTKNLNQFEWDVNQRLFRMKDMSWTAGLNLKLSNKTFQKKADKNTEEKTDKKGKGKEKTKAGSIEWAININYNLRYGMQHSYMGYSLTKDENITQTIGLSGNMQLTPNWGITFRTGYDFETKEISYTSVDIHRDLHCWEMHFNWVPFGGYKSWNFGINIKSAMFKDLKIEKKQSHLDY